MELNKKQELMNPNHKDLLLMICCGAWNYEFCFLWTWLSHFYSKMFSNIWKKFFKSSSLWGLSRGHDHFFLNQRCFQIFEQKCLQVIMEWKKLWYYLMKDFHKCKVFDLEIHTCLCYKCYKLSISSFLIVNVLSLHMCYLSSYSQTLTLG